MSMLVSGYALRANPTYPRTLLCGMSMIQRAEGD